MLRVIIVGLFLMILVIGIVLVSPHSDCTISVVQSSGETHQVSICR